MVSGLMGWTYFLAWSASFYPQLWSNFRRKNVVGLSFDFLTFNIIGHTAYLVYNLALLPCRGPNGGELCRLYYQRFPATTGAPVHPNDVAFSIHAVALTAITIAQCFVYESGTQRVSTTTRWIAGAMLASCAACGGLVLVVPGLNGLSFLTWLANLKVVITFAKLAPQGYLSYKRKLTTGYAIGQVLLDMSVRSQPSTPCMCHTDILSRSSFCFYFLSLALSLSLLSPSPSRNAGRLVEHRAAPGRSRGQCAEIRVGVCEHYARLAVRLAALRALPREQPAGGGGGTTKTAEKRCRLSDAGRGIAKIVFILIYRGTSTRAGPR